MKKILILTIFLFTICLNGFGQSTPKQGTADYLFVKGGFKIFKLGKIFKLEEYNKEYKHIKPYLYNYPLSKSYTITDPKLLTVGDNIKIDSIGIETYKDTICRIFVYVNKKDSDKFLAALIVNYGAGEEGYYPKSKEWNTKNKEIRLSYVPATINSKAVFIHNRLNEVMQEYHSDQYHKEMRDNVKDI